VLDEEDLALIGEANPEWERKTTTQVSFSVKFMMDSSNARCSPSSSA
jgi:hypothetical protein